MTTHDHPATLPDLTCVLRVQAVEAAAHSPESTVNPGYTRGFANGWRTAVVTAEECARLEARDWVTPLRWLTGAYTDHIRRAQANRAVPAAAPTAFNAAAERGGTVDALNAALRLTSDALGRAEAHAEAARREEVAVAPDPDPDDLADWSAYPRVPFPDDQPLRNLSDLAMFLGGDGTSFTGDLLRLIGKADPENLNLLGRVYPRHVRAWLMWRACSPVPASTLVALLEATHLSQRARIIHERPT